MNSPLKMAIVGTGYVADQYARTLPFHPELKLLGAFDRNAEHLDGFCRLFSVRRYDRLEELLEDGAVELVLNLTNPRSHFEITRRALEAGKHVYSEKPLGMSVSEARQLAALAEQRGLRLASAPCSLLCPTAQTMWKAVRDQAVGKIRLVYANFDDGMIAPNLAPWTWENDCGAPWPAKDEFEIGCTYEHAGYVLTWLAAIFGPARRVTAFASCQIPDKGIPVEKMAPDFSVGCIEYADGVVARVTIGLVAPRDKSITLVGDQGTISTANVRHDDSPVYVRKISAGGMQARLQRRFNPLRKWLKHHLSSISWMGRKWSFPRKYPFAIKPSGAMALRRKRVDFLLGPGELAAAIRQNRKCRLSAQLGVHIVELIEALQYPERFNYQRKIESTFDPIEPV
ncbi:MAG: Gfo/Idh/MocA family oxidoreductase [Tepidisphaeraceae bacterium]